MSLHAGLQIGLVGCGRWGKNILRDLVSLDCEVHVVAHDIESKGNAREYGAHEILDTLSMLKPDLMATSLRFPQPAIGRLSNS